MVVVKTLTPRDERDRSEIPRGVLEILVTPVVAQAVDRRGQDEDVEEAGHGRDEKPPPPEDQAEDRGADQDAGRAVVERPAVPPVPLDVLRVLRDRLGVARLAD